MSYGVTSIAHNNHTDFPLLKSILKTEPSFLREDDELPANFSYLCEDKASNKKHTPAGLASVQNLTVAWLDKNATDEDVLKLQKHCRYVRIKRGKRGDIFE
jgi:hypothetical protein